MAADTGITVGDKIRKMLSSEELSNTQDPVQGSLQPAKEDVQRFQKLLEDDIQPVSSIQPGSVTNVNEAVPGIPGEIQDKEVALQQGSQLIDDINAGLVSPSELIRLQNVIGSLQVQGTTTTQVSQKVEQGMDTVLKE